jgi:hypothetical protein
MSIKVITKLPNSEQSYKGKVKKSQYYAQVFERLKMSKLCTSG